MPRLETILAQRGIGIEFKYKSGSKEIQGVSFNVDEYKLKGSAVDRSCSYKNLNDFLQNNTLVNQIKTTMETRAQEALITNAPAENISVLNQVAEWSELLEDMGYAFGGGNDEDDARKRRKRGIGR